MDFFKNLFGDIKDVFGSAGQKISDTFSGFKDSVGNAINYIKGTDNTASAANAVPGTSKGVPNMSVNASTLPNLGKDAMGNNVFSLNGKPVVLDQYGKVNTLATGIINQGSVGQGGLQPSPFTTAASQFGGGTRPINLSGSQGSSGYQKPVDQYGRQSTKAMGEQYYTSTGKLVTPKVAFSGVQGTGNNSIMSPAFGAASTGNPGIPGGSAFTGTLGAAGMYSSSPFSGTSESEEDKKTKSKMDELFGGQNRSVLGRNFIAGITPGTTSGLSTPMANFAPNLPIVAPRATVPSMDIPEVNPLQELDRLDQPENPVFKTAYAESPNDAVATDTTIQENFIKERTVLDQQYPVDEVPLITDTPEQELFIQQSEDPFGIQQALDEYKSSNTQLMKFESQRIDLMKNIQALNNAYTPIINDIKNNPDLPKALAARRLTDLNVKQKEVLIGFQNQLELVNQAISDQNEQVNRNFGILERAQSRAEREQDNARQLFGMLVSTGAIGGMSDSELKQLSGRTGIALNALKKAKTSANDPYKDIITETDNAGNVRGIDKKTGKVVWTVPGAGKSSANAGTNSPAGDAYGESLYQQLKTRSITYASLPAAEKKLAIDIFGAKGETIPRALTAKELAAKDDATSGISAVENLLNMYKNGDGLPLTADMLAPAGSLRAVGGKFLDPRLSEFQTNAAEATDIKTRIRTGAALNESEIKFYESQRPQLGDRPEDIEKKLNNLLGFYLGMSGVPVTVTDSKGQSYQFDDLFNESQRLGLRRAINEGYELSY